MKKLTLKISFYLLALTFLTTSLYGQDTTKVTSTFIGSQGYLLESDTKKVALDAIIYWEGDNYGYIKPPIEIKTKIENADSPFNELDLILISHAHKDHYNSTMIEKSMNNNPGALLITNSEVYSKIASEVQDISTFEDRIWIPDLGFYQSIDTLIKDIPLTITNIEHGPDKLYVYSFVLDGIRFVQLNSWNSITGEMYDTLGFNKERADVAFLGYNYILDASKFSLFKEHINPVFSTISHIDGASISRFNTIQNVINTINGEYPMNLLYTPMDQLTFRKTMDKLIVDTTTNKAPVVVYSIPDQTDTIGNLYSYTIPDSIFIDNDSNDTLTFAAALSNGSALPDSLSFDPITKTISGKLIEIGSFNIKVTATDIVGASVTDIFILMVKEDVTTINDINTNNNLTIFPNPATHTIQVSANGLMVNIISYQIIDMSGKIVKQAIFNSEIIDMSELNKGLFFIHFKTDKDIISKRIVIE